METRIKNWPSRLQVCIDQLTLAIQSKDSESIDQWLKSGFIAIENCENMLNANGIDPKDIELINSKITHFKEICKDND
jgi:hypothetical protein